MPWGFGRSVLSSTLSEGKLRSAEQPRLESSGIRKTFAHLCARVPAGIRKRANAADDGLGRSVSRLSPVDVFGQSGPYDGVFLHVGDADDAQCGPVATSMECISAAIGVQHWDDGCNVAVDYAPA